MEQAPAPNLLLYSTMTRLGLISDIHSDVEALEAVLAKLDDCGCSQVVCAGDAIDFDLPPGTEETVELLRSRDVVCIRGNHERWILDESRENRLSRTAVERLRTLPTSWSSIIDGIRFAMHHARPGSDMDGIDESMIDPGEVPGLLAEAEADVLIVGHTHAPMVFDAPAGSGMIVNPGALMQSRADVQSAWILDPESGSFSKSEPRPGGTFAVVEMPSLRVEVFSVDRRQSLTGLHGC